MRDIRSQPRIRKEIVLDNFDYIFQVNKFKDGNRELFISICKDYNTALSHLISYIWKNKDNIKGALVPHFECGQERFNVVSIGDDDEKISMQIYPVARESLIKL